MIAARTQFAKSFRPAFGVSPEAAGSGAFAMFLGAAPAAADEREAVHSIEAIQLREFLQADGLDRVLYSLNAAHRAEPYARCAAARRCEVHATSEPHLL